MEANENLLNLESAKNLIWKRPDGYHRSEPSDFKSISIDEEISVWVHKDQPEAYPFRINGDWLNERQSKFINQLISALNNDPQSVPQKITSVLEFYDLSPAENTQQMVEWLQALKAMAKGDDWEIEIIHRTLECVQSKVKSLHQESV